MTTPENKNNAAFGASEFSALLERLWNEQADEHNQWRDLGLDEMLEFAASVERKACWDAINDWIVPGDMRGNGCDETAQRNGMILAGNIVMERITRSNRR